MCANESYIDDAVGIVDPNNEAILVAGNIEHGSAVFEDAGGPKIAFNIRRRGPVGSFDLPIPCHDWIARIGMGRTSVEEGLERRSLRTSDWPAIISSARLVVSSCAALVLSFPLSLRILTGKNTGKFDEFGASRPM